MVNTLWLPVVVPHGDDNSNADVFMATSSSGLPRMEWRLRCTTRETACPCHSSQTMMLAATHVATFTFSFRQMQWPNVVPAPVMYGAPAPVYVLTTTKPQWSNRMLQHLQFSVRLHPRCTSTRGRVCGTRADFLDLPVPVVQIVQFLQVQFIDNR